MITREQHQKYIQATKELRERYVNGEITSREFLEQRHALYQGRADA